MNKIIHGVVLALFGAAYWFVSLILRLPGLGPYLLLGLAILATAYCLRVWMRKPDTGNSWVAFLSTSVAALGLLMLPTIVAIYLPVVDALNRLPRS
jgi:hypothetical protein